MEAAPSCGIGMLTLYAFSGDNWARPSREVALLMRLFRRYLVSEVDAASRMMSHAYHRPARPDSRRASARDCRRRRSTRHGTKLDLRIAVDYPRATRWLRRGNLGAANEITREFWRRTWCGRSLDRPARVMSTLLIRTGESSGQRLPAVGSAYAELYFTDRRWPEFTAGIWSRPSRNSIRASAGSAPCPKRRGVK